LYDSGKTVSLNETATKKVVKSIENKKKEPFIFVFEQSFQLKKPDEAVRLVLKLMLKID
jgi:hypothetical protein